MAPRGQSKRQTATGADALLQKIEHWQQVLAENIVLRNPTLEERDVNLSVQRIIDRLVFLHICERRGIEEPSAWSTILDGPGVYARLCERFQHAARIYPSSLFHFHPDPQRTIPDKLTLTLTLDDAPLREILDDAHRSDVWADVPADMLGQVYERFLGKVIRWSTDRHVIIEPRPEVRKAGGVFYTPTSVVESIVNTTVGALVAGRTPKDVAHVRILDPACGSGSFLLGAYQFLLDWHHAWYTTHRPEQWARGRNPAIARTSAGNWQLTTKKRCEILANNIFGVDLDEQATQVASWSLLLVALGDQKNEPRHENLPLFPGMEWPNLENNIRRGNSLVGPDFHDGAQTIPPPSSDDPVAPFDWQRAFPHVFAAGGFDAVLGNPPYLSFGGRQAVDLPPGVRDYLIAHYESAGWPTAHSLFMERSIKLLTKRFVSFIVPDQVGHLEGYRSIREIMGKHARVREVRYWGESVFRGVTTPALTFVLDKGSSGPTTIVNKDGSSRDVHVEPGDVWGGSAAQQLLQKLQQHSFSIKPYVADCGIRTTSAKEQVVALAEAQGQFVPVLEGKQIGRYRCSPPEMAVRLDTGHDLYKSKEEKYQNAQYILRQTAPYPIVAPHDHTTYFRNSLHGLSAPEQGSGVKNVDIRYLVGLLNSKLLRFAYVEMIRESQQRTFPQVKLGALALLPLRSINFAVDEQRTAHDQLVEQVARMLDLHRKLQAQRNSKRIQTLQRQIKKLDDDIDKSVYVLYNLTDAEMAAVEKVVSGLTPPP